MPDTDGVLAAIDACLEDYGVSEDAMRWAPDEPEPPQGIAPSLFWAVAPPADEEPSWRPISGVVTNDGLRYDEQDTVFPGLATGWPIVESLRLEPAVSVFSGLVADLQHAAQSIGERFSKALAPAFAAVTQAFHKLGHQEDRKHYRRCPTCNPRGFPKPLPINGHMYNQRRRKRNRR